MADTPIPADVLEPTISPQNPALIIAGIKHFGLASDGSDLRDLAATVSAQEADRAAQAERIRELEVAAELARVWINENLREGDIAGCTALSALTNVIARAALGGNADA